MFKHILKNIKLGFYYLIQGLISGDKVLTNTSKDETLPSSGIEQKQEQQSVYKDLLRGEVTQEVKELRHQLYFVERKSHEYDYIGGGLAKKKKNSIFDYQGSVENSIGLNVKLVQDNKPIIKSLEEEGVHLDGENTIIDNKLSGTFQTESNINKEYIVHCERSFMPRFRIEQYATKVVVMNATNGFAIVDFYVPQYSQQFNKTSKLFQAEVDRVYQGNRRSDLTLLTKIWFVTHNCYGADDMLFFEFVNPRFDNIIKFDGSYILRFYCKIESNGIDGIDKFYNEEMAKKYENQEAREDSTIDFNTAEAVKNRAELDLSEDLDLLNRAKSE